MKVIRHGDLTLVCNAVLPKGVTPANTNIIMKGNSGNDHAVKQSGTIYFQESGRYIIGFLIAHRGCQLVHPDHGNNIGKTRVANIPEGAYELRRQVEHTNEGLRPVID